MFSHINLPKITENRQNQVGFEGKMPKSGQKLAQIKRNRAEIGAETSLPESEVG